MWFSDDCNRMCAHRSKTVPLASHNPINGGNKNKERKNGKERRKRGREWTNRKERGSFGDGWDYFLSAKIVS